MPRTLDPAKYPDEFPLLLERALVEPVVIPHDAPAGLRGYLQAYLRACEAAGGELAEKAKRLQVTATGKDSPCPSVTIQNRSEGVYAHAVRSALGTSVQEQADAAQSDFAKRLAALGS